MSAEINRFKEVFISLKRGLCLLKAGFTTLFLVRQVEINPQFGGVVNGNVSLLFHHACVNNLTTGWIGTNSGPGLSSSLVYTVGVSTSLMSK